MNMSKNMKWKNSKILYKK